MRSLNLIIKQAPPQTVSYFAGVPMMRVLDPAMRTVSGYTAFQDPEINAMFKKVLNVWAAFLASPGSTGVLHASASGWFSPEALAQLTATANSWDAFFTRAFREGVRPIASPNDDSVIVNACEARPFAVARNIKGRDIFWIKEQRYSLYDMIGSPEIGGVGDRFVGGTVYQAYLDAYSYHRWHAPVSGRITRTYILDGTYYSTPLPIDPDPAGEVQVAYQHYLACMATRAVIVIDADDDEIGEVAFLDVGMEEVSTCKISVKEGERVEKGDQLGMFHYGGSSYCLIFEEGVNLLGFPELDRQDNVPVCGKLAVVVGEKQLL